MIYILLYIYILYFIYIETTMGKKMNFQHDGSMAIFEAYNG